MSSSLPPFNCFESAERQRKAMAKQHLHDQQVKQAKIDSVARVARKSPVDGHAMRRFFGPHWRPKAELDLPRKTHREGPETKPCDRAASHDMDLPLELVEAILSHLPVFDLIVATGVNMTFRKIIQNSPTLRKNMFLRPSKEPALYVQFGFPEKGSSCRVAVAVEYGFEDEYYDGDDYTGDDYYDDEYSGDEYDGNESDDGKLDPAPVSRWTEPFAVASLCPFLILSRPNAQQRSVCDRMFVPEIEQAFFSKLAAVAEPWANMYLTNPPCNTVVIDLDYHGSYADEFSICAKRTVYCEYGVTLAALYSALHMKGDVEVSIRYGWWANRAEEDMLAVHKDTTVQEVIEEWEETGNHSEYSSMKFSPSRTVVKFPGIVFREWRAESPDVYVRRGEDCLSHRGYQVIDSEDVLQ